MNTIYFPAGSGTNKQAHEHYANTIAKPIKINDIKHLLSDEELSKLVRVAKDGQTLYVWGHKINHKLSSKTGSRVNTGDLALFLQTPLKQKRASKRLQAYGVVSATITNEMVAEKLWGKDEDNNSWDHIQFYSSINEIEENYNDYCDAVGEFSGTIMGGTFVAPAVAVNVIGHLLTA